MPAAIFSGDQPTSVTAQVGAVEAQMSGSELDGLVTATGEAAGYLFTANYNFVWNGQTLSFRTGIAYQLDGALLAALTSQAAPIVGA